MISMEILYAMISKITETILAMAIIYVVAAAMGALTALFALMGIVGAVFTALIIAPLGYFITIVALGAIAGPFEVAHNRYYLYLKKNGIRAKAISIFDSFDFFVQFALVTGTRMVTIMWVPLLEAVLVLADIAGGTPYNRAAGLSMTRPKVRVISGLNSSMLMDLCMRNITGDECPDVDALAADIMQTGHENIGKFVLEVPAQPQEDEDGI